MDLRLFAAVAMGSQLNAHYMERFLTGVCADGPGDDDVDLDVQLQQASL